MTLTAPGQEDVMWGPDPMKSHTLKVIIANLWCFVEHKYEYIDVFMLYFYSQVMENKQGSLY
jgi:hypothetical protein